MALRCVGDMEAYWTYALSTDVADFVHCEPRWYSTRVIALRMGGMQQYGISVSIFEQGNLQGNSSGPSDPPGLVVCLFLLFPPGAFRRLGWLFILEFLPPIVPCLRAHPCSAGYCAQRTSSCFIAAKESCYAWIPSCHFPGDSKQLHHLADSEVRFNLR